MMTPGRAAHVALVPINARHSPAISIPIRLVHRWRIFIAVSSLRNGFRAVLRDQSASAYGEARA
jgi:hypothetical protein